MTITIPVKVEIKAVAESSFTQERLEQRLQLLRSFPMTLRDEKEVEYLNSVKERKGWK